MVDKKKFQQFEGINISIYGKSVHVTDGMKDHAMTKLEKLERLNDHILDIHVILDIQKIDHHVTIVAHFSHFTAKVEAVTTDMYVSIDKAVEKLQATLRKWKGKIQDHHKRSHGSIDLPVRVIQREDEIEEFNQEIAQASKKEYEWPKVMSKSVHTIKNLTESEAVMKLELAKDPFLVYRAEEDQKLKVMYRLHDGNYGVICPTG